MLLFFKFLFFRNLPAFLANLSAFWTNLSAFWANLPASHMIIITFIQVIYFFQKLTNVLSKFTSVLDKFTRVFSKDAGNFIEKNSNGTIIIWDQLFKHFYRFPHFSLWSHTTSENLVVRWLVTNLYRSINMFLKRIIGSNLRYR